MSNGPRRTSGFLPGGFRQRAVELAIGQQSPMDMNAMMAPGSVAGQVAAGTAMSPLSLRTMALRGATRPRTQAEVLRAYFGAPSKLPQPDVAAPTSTGIADTVAGYLPETGTPEMAGLGAAGRTMIQLGGWQDQPYTLGQILGAGAEKGLEAMKARQDAMTAAAEKKAAAEQKAKEFALEERYKEAQIEKIKREDKFKPGTPFDVQTKEGVRKAYFGPSGELVYVGIAKPEDKKKPSENIFTVTIPGKQPMEIRGDDPELNKYLGESGRAQGARVTKAGQIVGSRDEVLSGLTKAEYSKQVLSVFNAKENINRLQNVSDTFEDDFLRIGGKIELAGAKVADWGNFASKEQKDLIKRVSDWQLNAWNQVNDRIKAITGAQMSEAEAKRIMKELPDPSSADFFKISSPVEYKAKLERALQNAKLAVARQQYFLKNGLEPTFYKTERTENNPRGFDVFYESEDGVVGLDSMKGIMRKKAREFAKQYEGLPEGEARQMIIRDMESMFGLGI